MTGFRRPADPPKGGPHTELVGGHPHRTALGAAAVAGTALWFSRGELDVVGSLAAPLRVALLPSWPELAGVVLVALLAAGIAALLLLPHVRRAPTGERTLAWDAGLSDALRPLYALAILAVPYLPWLPDRVPVLRLFAGPGRWLIWSVVLGQVGWILLQRFIWHSRRDTNRGVNLLSRSVAVFAVSLAVYAGAWAGLRGTGILPGGDEPHYLVMSQSLVLDGDLAIENNHERGDYGDYFPVQLKPDYRTRGSDGKIYSIHPIGLPILTAPAFAVGGYRGVVCLLLLIAAATAMLIWRWALALTGSAGIATFAWAAVALSAPYVFNSFTVYPEIPAALCVMLAAGLLVPDEAGAKKGTVPFFARLWLAALAVAALPWLSTKYVGMAIVLAGVLAWHHRQPARAVVLGSFAASLACWFGFFYVTWGSPLPSAPYGPDMQTSPLTFASGGPGLLFDQEYGIYAYAPVLVLGLVGLWEMWRDRSTRLLAVELALAGTALLLLVGSFGLWWGGSAMPGRPVVSMLPLLAAPIAWHCKAAAARQLDRSAVRLLLIISLVVTATLTLAADGRLVSQGRDGSSTLLEWLSPTWHLWSSAPTYVMTGPAVALVHTLLWVGAAALVAWFCRRSAHITTAGRGALRAVLSTTIISVIVVSAAAQTPGAYRAPQFDPEARIFSSMLDTFDGAARPVAVRYDPFSVVSPEAIPPLFSMNAVPGQRLLRQPLPVMLNARFRLPAGEYEVELAGSESADNRQGTIGLQIGREGNPVHTWPLDIASNGTWQQRFELPLDAEFVAFRTVPEVERAVSRLRLRPVRIVDAGRRLQTEPVLSAASFGSITVFFHDGYVFSEPAGFWIRGRSVLRATIAKSDKVGESIPLSIHSGARPNTVVLSTPRWSERIDLVPNVTRAISIPSAPGESLLPLTITTRSGFVPAEVDANSSDRRLLGCWIAFAQ